jgi:hypothetical protein
MHEIISPLKRSWRHHEGTTHYFDSDYAGKLIEEFNANGATEPLQALLVHVEPLAKSILEYRASTKHEELDELLARIRLKLWKSLRLFNPAKGTAFTFCAQVINSAAMSTVGEVWAYRDKYFELNDENGFTASPALGSAEALDDIVYRVRQAKSACRNPYERRAQRWFIESFIDAGFVLRRHEAADAVMQVFSITHARSRQLHDLTMLEVRRQLIGEKRLPLITPDLLRGTKIQAINRYAKFLSENDFSKLAVLLRDLAPSLVLLMRPENACRIRRGEPEATRNNLRLILDGEPRARPLFRGI